MKIKLYPPDQPPYRNQLDGHKLIDKYINERINDPEYQAQTIVIKSSRQIYGKTQFAINELVRFSITFPNATCGYISPTFNQSKETFQKITKSFSEIIKSSNASDLEIIFTNKSRIKLFSAESRKNLRGFTTKHLLVIDEAAFIADDIYFEMVSPWLIVNRPLTIMISTPYFTDGFFYKYYLKGLEQIDNNVLTLDWCKDYPENIDKNHLFLKNIKTEMPLRKYNTEYMGEWLSDDDHSIFKNIKECITTTIIASTNVYMGIDFGTGSGKDSHTITTINEHNQVIDIYNNNDISPTEFTTIIKQYIEKYKPKNVCADGTAIGKIYKDMLKNDKINYIIFSNSKKRKMVEKLIILFEKKNIEIPDFKPLIDELLYFEIQKTPNNKITYNAAYNHKDDIITSLYLAVEAKNNNKIKIQIR